MFWSSRTPSSETKSKAARKPSLRGKPLVVGLRGKLMKGNMSPKILPLERRFLISLAGAGVQAVIAKSFAFIYGRNQPSLGLLGITTSDDAFFEAGTEGEEIMIDMPTRTIVVGGR